MSFCDANRNSRPGFITGNPLCGMCEKICIHTKRVMDACLSLRPRENQLIELGDITPAAPPPVAPLTFVSCAPSATQGIISNVQITDIPNSNRRVRVTCDVGIPTAVLFTDSTGAEYRGTGLIAAHMDVIMCRPNNSIMPFEPDSTVNITCFDGRWTGEGLNFDIDCCTAVLMRLSVDCDLLVPSYGYCPINPCRDYDDNPCREIFNRPLYPPSRL